VKSNLRQPSEEQYLHCIRCGLCLAVCPTYRETLSETASPRGRVALARKGLEGDLEISPNLIEQMYACFDCLACDDICPVGIRPADLALNMRSYQEQRQPKAWKKIFFNGIVSKPKRMEISTGILRLFEQAGLRRLVNSPVLHKMLPARVSDMEAMPPRFPPRALRRVLPEVVPASGENRTRLGFFLGCAQSLLFADESAASIKVLARNGCTVVCPKDTVCCGMPAMGFGIVDQARQQAHHNIALYEKADVEFIITDCATCGSSLKDYARLLAGDPAWAERARLFSDKVRDISEYLINLPLKKPLGRIEAKVTYHDPCHLRRGQGIWKQPRDLLKMIDGLEFVELPEADWCCGLAGTQLITHYETSIKVLKRKTDNLASTKAKYVASGCPACQMQLNVGVQRQWLDMQVTHPVMLLDQAYRNEKEKRWTGKSSASSKK
jgi:glycolate oxidase iron-sulfur subunit